MSTDLFPFCFFPRLSGKDKADFEDWVWESHWQAYRLAKGLAPSTPAPHNPRDPRLNRHREPPVRQPPPPAPPAKAPKKEPEQPVRRKQTTADRNLCRKQRFLSLLEKSDKQEQEIKELKEGGGQQ